MAKGPTISMELIEQNIRSESYFTAYEGVLGERFNHEGPDDIDKDEGTIPGELKLLTFCVLVLTNGFTIAGTSACAAPENFNKEMGQKIAREKAVEQMWPLMGYELRSSLYLADQQASAPAQRAEGERQAEGHDAVGTGPAEAALSQTLASTADTASTTEVVTDGPEPSPFRKQAKPVGELRSGDPSSSNTSDPYA